MNEKKNSAITAQEKIERLRTAFLEQLPSRIAQLKVLWEQLKLDTSDHDTASELHRLLHNIKGTSRSFGFITLGEEAARAEALTSEFLSASTSKASSEILAQQQRCIDECLIRLKKATFASSYVPANGKHLFSRSSLAEQCEVRSPEKMVYICDDEELTLELLSSQIKCFGYENMTFLEPQSLCSAAIEHWPDAVIMDINFPQGQQTGPEAMEMLQRQTGQTVPLIFISARNDFEARLHAVRAGGSAYFLKPAHPLDLVAALDKLTEQHKPEAFRILVVDDEDEVASYHCIILQEAGMITSKVTDPTAVLDVLQEFHPDLILMDMYMPKCNGSELARLIRQIPEHVSLPIVYLSSETDRTKQFSAMRIGVEGFLTKPVVPEELVEAVVIRAERMRTLRSLMVRDSLTGLFNHTTTTQFLKNAIASAIRTNGNLCFAMIDIDYFKKVNDTYGHPVGDQVLLALSRVLQQRLRTSDIIGRYGGEEFAVIMQNSTIECAVRLIDELRHDFSQIRFNARDSSFSCTFSAGIAGSPGHDSMEMLRKAADNALYEAKRSGRNRVSVDSLTCHARTAS